ncbi:MAG: alpha/beta fold hydrolase [Chroococcales cyanobacterium]
MVVINLSSWEERIGRQRDWVWRGWQTRYTYVRSLSSQPTPPIILLHGFGASIEHWRHNLPVLSQHHTVYALDLLGFGASKKASVDYNINLWVQQIYDFWQTFIGQPVILVGNSIGSQMGLAAAAAHPEMGKGVVMLSLPDTSLLQDGFPSWMMSLERSVKQVVASPPLLKLLFFLARKPAFVKRWAGLAYANRNAVTDELVEILLGPAHDEGAARAFSALFKAMISPQFAPSAKEILPTLTIPMLLIWGSSDFMIPAKLAHRFKELNPNLELVTLENVGHCPHDECPEQFNEIVLNWLSTKFALNSNKLEV